MRFTKRIITFVLAATMLFAAAACKHAENGKGDVDDIEFWSAPITEKIMRDQHDIYDEVRTDAKITVSAARNEYESGQLIMTAAKDIDAYDVSVNELTLADGTEFPAENISVYQQMYIEIPEILNGTQAPVGWYPDALVPFSAVRNAGENKFAAGNNQGLWFEFSVPATQAPGIYEGSVTISAGGRSKDIPVELKVWDFTISEETHSRSIFHSNWTFDSSELDSSVEMLNKYNFHLSKFRLSPWQFLDQINYFNESDLPEWTEYMWEFAKEPRNSTFCLPFRPVMGATEWTFDEDLFVKSIKAVAYKSFEENMNLMKKAAFYNSFIDEPNYFPEDAGANLKGVVPAFRRGIQRAAEELAADESITSPLKDEVIADIANIRNVVTSPYVSTFEEYIDTWCPGPNFYDTEEMRANYADQEERWWYTCSTFRNPYPSYHIEDNLYSARLLSWMAIEYDVVGNLYWATNYGVDAVTGLPMEDYYQKPARAGANGEGFLLYPGKRYGIDGPVDSIRIHTIRDGNEDYEILYALENGYEAVSRVTGEAFSANDILSTLYRTLYDGTKVYTTADRFEAAKQTLYELYDVYDSSAEMVIVDFVNEGEAATFTVMVKDGFDLKADGSVVADYTEKNGFRVYRVRKDLSSAANTVTFSVAADGTEKSVTFALGGRAERFGADKLLGHYSSENGTFELEGNYVKVSLSEADADTTQIVTLAAAVLGDISAATDRMTIELKNASDENIPFRILFEYENSTVYSSVLPGTLEPGEKTVTIGNLFAYNWAKNGKLKNIHIYFGDKGDAAREVYIGGITVYGV